MGQRKALLLWLFLCSFIPFMMSGCGTGEGAATTTPGTGGTVVIPPAAIQLLVDSPQLNSDGVLTVTLTAQVTDANNNALSGQAVTFSTTPSGALGGILAVTSGTTNASGIASATLGTGGDKTNRTISVTAATGSFTDAVTVTVVGTTLSVSGQSSLVFGAHTLLTIFLKDSSGAGIANQTITVTSASGNTLSSSTVTTGANGQATVTVTASVPGDDTITVAALNASATHVLAVSNTTFAFTAPASGADVNIGVAQPVTVHYAIGGVNQPGVPVSFTTTRGAITGGDVTATSDNTDAGGNATVNVSATTAGPALLTASVAAGPSVQVPIEFVAITPATMTIQASPATISTNSGGSTTQQSTITARIWDAAGNLVKNKRISFVLTDTSGGSIDPAAATTNSAGEASTVYTAGSAPSALNGVRIDASVDGFPAVTAFTTLTVAGRSLSVILGTGNAIVAMNDTTYKKDYSAVVTDAAGNPVVGATVTTSLVPVSYRKGHYVVTTSGWVQVLTLLPVETVCTNEDMRWPGTNNYLNGILDAGEDLNLDGMLTPGGVASVTASTTTDQNGFGLLSLTYPKEYATWVRVRLEARTSVSGSEAVGTAIFWLPGAGSDYSNTGVTPPGVVSHFGDSATCADAL